MYIHGNVSIQVQVDSMLLREVSKCGLTEILTYVRFVDKYQIIYRFITNTDLYDLLVKTK